MRSDGVEAGAAHDAAQDGGDDDGVVCVAEDGDEVRNQISRDCQIGRQQRQPDADAAGKDAVGGRGAG